ncbi:MAG: hypothetical protein KC416_03635 [Myxococcales bacterium]|nr:hypothetical protein [Myxococcales bacterium]
MSRIVRPAQAPSVLVPAAEVRARREAEEILAYAHREAEALRHRAEQEMEALRDADRREATERAEGQIAGRLLSLEKAFSTARSEMAHDVVGLAIKVAETILREELPTDPSRMDRWIKTALERLPGAHTCEAEVHPSDGPRLEALGLAVTLIHNDQLSPGEVVLRSNVGTVDLRIDAQLEAIEIALREGP